ncbi:Cation efflux system protein CzcA [Candidatus Nitrospira nitrosa]|uniref:Cation efflux system protein CzcA n=1 Tax=Candidatus Nitrospira nitrosa TaxID=1742972 RepID=A0A0S4LML1_9BACT|nr:CusA/CzcA family heavy metal efflux RND transporter [Candidatus Nitrospira nitrosa]CUS38803.1 Cation efflux system protein CzcA [Candidatus Nitrospira nitrosa]
MVSRLLDISLRQRLLIIICAVLLGAGGVYAFRTIPIDAFPDVTSVLVQVVTKAPGLSPTEVERLVTYPIELQLTGVPSLTEMRSLTKVGLSLITIVFDDSMDINLARQLVLERLLEVEEQLPPGAEPMLVPNSTGLGEVFQYYLDSPRGATADAEAEHQNLIAQRTIQDWVIRPILKSTPEVIDVNSMGGYVKQYQVLVEPGLLRKYNLTLRDVFDAVAKNNANAGGNILEKHAEKYIVRGTGLIRSIEDIERIVVRETGGTPVYVSDVAQVVINHAVRHGATVLNGDREVVSGIVLMLRGGNARDVVQGLKARVEEIHSKGLLPNGLRIVPFYDRIELITEALNTVYKSLAEGVVLVVVVLFLFLGNIRSALIVVGTLVLAPLATFIVMGQIGLTANLMSLGGLAIAIGMIVDGSVVVVENVYRHLSHHSAATMPRLQLVTSAVKEVGQPVVFGILIIILVFLPLLSLHGMEGKMFKPLAYTIMIALLVSLLLSLTLSPVLCSLALRHGSEEDPWIVRMAKAIYAPALHWALGHRVAVLAMAIGALIGALSLVPSLGTEFIPTLNEGSVAPQTIRLPSVSLPASIEIEKRMQQAIMEFPEVEMVVSKIGRTELGNDPQEPNESDPVVRLKPLDQWTTARTMPELMQKFRERLTSVSGATFLISQPIQQRVDELISGVRTEATVKLFGDDLETLRNKAQEIAEVLEAVRGVRDIKVEQLYGQPYLTIDIDRSKIARHGINVADVREIISTAIGGDVATRVYEGQQRFDLVVRFPKAYRDSVETISNIKVSDRAGALIPLADLGTVQLGEGPGRISREQLQRYVSIGFNTLGRDIGSLVAEAQQKIDERVTLPTGYRVTWGGSFENMERAMAKLRVIVPITIVLIFFLLYSTFNSLRQATLIILNLPFALIGGIVALWLTKEYLSVPASIGFINLFGVAVLNGIVLVSYMNKLREDGHSLDEAVTSGALLRLRPVLMTALVALLGLVPLAFARGIGSEVQRPLAIVVIGGLVSSTLLTLIMLPVLYRWLEGRVQDPRQAGGPPTGSGGELSHTVGDQHHGNGEPGFTRPPGEISSA